MLILFIKGFQPTRLNLLPVAFTAFLSDLGEVNRQMNSFTLLSDWIKKAFASLFFADGLADEHPSLAMCQDDVKEHSMKPDQTPLPMVP